MAGRMLAALAVLACIVQGGAQSHPLTIDERIAACEASEDAEPERAIALAQSVLDNLPAATSLQKSSALGCRGWSRAILGQRDEAQRDAYALVAQLESLGTTPERVRLTRRADGILHRGSNRVGAIQLYARAALRSSRHPPLYGTFPTARAANDYRRAPGRQRQSGHDSSPRAPSKL